MLKAVKIILSLYLVLLAFIPCGDPVECNLIDQPTLSISETPHQDHTHSGEFCSPFCICSCCGQLVYASVFTYFKLPHVRTDAPTRIAYAEKQVSEPLYTIWQPPKLI